MHFDSTFVAQGVTSGVTCGAPALLPMPPLVAPPLLLPEPALGGAPPLLLPPLPPGMPPTPALGAPPPTGTLALPAMATVEPALPGVGAVPPTAGSSPASTLHPVPRLRSSAQAVDARQLEDVTRVVLCMLYFT